MKKILALGLILFFGTFKLNSQQLYVSSISVNQGADEYCNGSTGVDRSLLWDPVGARIEFDYAKTGYPAGCLSLCAWITAVIQTTANANLGVDELSFEIFKFKAGANPLDPASTPPINTLYMRNIASFSMSTISEQTKGPFCTAWDGSYNVEGFWGKTNGRFGFRATVKTNMVSNTAGNINIQQTSVFPGQNQKPITVNVTNVHVVKATPTVVGKITGVGAQPYNILYRLSKDATVTITIEDSSHTPIRTIIKSLPRFGEGIPDGALMNGDFWDGRDDNGLLVPASNYYYRITASANDDYGWDIACGASTATPLSSCQGYADNISIDPLQITDIAIKDLGPLATDVAVISYMLTEEATVYLDIYPPGTTFTLNGGVNCGMRSTNCTSVTPIRTYIETKTRRQSVNMYWDGKDSNGNYLCDGQYVFALSAVTKGRGGELWTKRLGVGTVSIAKGDPLAFMNPSSTIVGSTPPAAGLNPFYFRYQLQRPAKVNLEIRDMSNNLVRVVVSSESRSSGLTNQEMWDGKKDDGTWASSGTYRAALTVIDPYTCMTNNTFTHDASIDVNLFRIVDVSPQHIIALSTQAAISYTLSQSMWTDVKIYKPTIEVTPSSWPWDSGVYSNNSNIVWSISGMRPGRYKVTEYWDGRDSQGYLVEDGRYPFTIVAYSTGTQKMYAIDKAYGYIDVSRGAIMFYTFNITPTIADMKNSSEVVKLPPYLIEYSLTRQSSVTITINDFNTNAIVARVVTGETRDPLVTYKDFWDGKCYKSTPTVCTDGQWMIGTYNVNVYARDVLANPNGPVTVSTVTMTIDNYPLRLYDLAVAPLTPESPAVISYQVSEPMKVVVKIYKPGTRFLAEQPVGCGTNEEGCLINKIVGVRPARTPITEYWDGKDMTGAVVPSGNYIFKIFASTDSTEISSLTGDCPNGICNSLADDIIIADLPAMQMYVEDVCKYFEENSYFAPNPFDAVEGNFRVAIPMLGNVEVRVYNINGEKVYSYDSKNKWPNGIELDSEGQCISGSTSFKGGVTCKTDTALKWFKTNISGKPLASGLYIAVFKFMSTQGTKELCQFRKKILVP
ncbi:MAG: FlgD immunoglobulin-like domain containing protein [Elusimicrobiota bacterium]